MEVSMVDLSNFPVTEKWRASRPDVIQLYSFPTPNGVKVSIALEEMGLDYEVHKVTLSDSDVKSPSFLSLNPNNKIPALIDPNGPNDTPIGLFESGAILMYLAEKTDQFLGSSPQNRLKIIQWLLFQMGGLGPMFGQLGYFHKFAGREITDVRPRQRYIDEAKRLMAVLEQELTGKDWIAEQYSIADMAIAPWLRALDFYDARQILDWDSHTNLVRYLDRFLARPAVQKGLVTPSRD